MQAHLGNRSTTNAIGYASCKNNPSGNSFPWKTDRYAWKKVPRDYIETYFREFKEKELGRPIQPLEFLQRMQCKDGQFIDERSKNVVDKVQNHINTMIRANGGSLEGIDMSKAYIETVGTIKGNVYGFGSWGQTLINNGVNTSTTSSTNQDEFFKNLKEELEQQFRAEMETLKAQMEAQVQSQVQSQVQEVMLALFRFGSYPPAANGGPSL